MVTSMVEKSFQTRRDVSNVPARYRTSRLTDYDQSRGDQRAYDAIVRYIGRRDQSLQDGVGLVLVGDPGVGKTLLASLILREMIERHRDFSRFETLPGLLSRKHKIIDLSRRVSFNGDAADAALLFEYQDLDSRILGDPVGIYPAFQWLVLDDVGKEYRASGSYSLDTFDELIRTRFDLGLPTIITTNVALKDWKSVYSPAMYSFLFEACLLIPVESADLRRPVLA